MINMLFYININDITLNNITNMVGNCYLVIIKIILI